ncbi:MAG: TIGR03943 family protein [Chthoniobacterales bacterium]
MTAIISRVLTSAALLLWGTVLTWFYFSGKVQSYLHPTFQIYTAISGILLVLMASIVLIFGFPECCNEENCVHTHGKLTAGRIFALFILVVPLFVAATVSPDQFGGTTVTNRGVIDNIAQLPGAKKTQLAQMAYTEPPLPGEDTTSKQAQTPPEAGDAYLQKNGKGQIVLQTIDLLYAADEPSMRKDFGGKEIEIIGQYMPAKVKNPTGKNFNLIRLYVMCCAADARPVAVTIEAPKAEKLTEMSWVKVTGKVTFQHQGDRFTPIVVANSVTPCDAPEDKFLY